MKKSIIYPILGIRTKLAMAVVAAFSAFAPCAMAETEVTGRVTDGGTGAALAGARVLIVGADGAAMTGDGGRFTLAVPDGKVTLRVEAPGYNTVTVPVRDASDLSVRLTATTGANFYDADIYGASSTASTSLFGIGEVTGDQSVADLQGQLLSITRSGMPGAGSAVFVEGLHSISASSQPLYIVDGVEWTVSDSEVNLLGGHFNNPLALIDPKDIAKISVMKNGTAIYGTKGGNGVVIIETKRARTEATEIEAWAMLGTRTKPKTIPVMDASQYRLYVSDVMSGMFANSSMVNRFNFLNDDPTSSTYAANHNNTDWYDLISRSGLMMNYGVSVHGGDDRALYGFSLGYTKNDGNIKDTSFDRLNIRFNSDINLWKGFKLRFDVAFAQATWHLFDDGIDAVSSPYYLSMVKSPLYHPNVLTRAGEPTVKFSDVDELGSGNPLAILDRGKGDSRNYRFNLNVAPSYRFNSKWAIEGLIGYTFDKVKENSFLPDYGVEDIDLVSSTGDVYAVMKNRVETMMNRRTSFNAALYGHYTPLSDYVNNLDVKLGYRYRNDTGQLSWGEGLNTSSDFMNSMGNTTSSLRSSYGTDSKWRNMSWLLSAEYSYLKRYIIGVSATMETSSRFGKEAEGAIRLGGVSWGMFPSVNAAWIFSSENFMKALPWINFARLRAGWEMAGNDYLPDYATGTYFASTGLLGHAYGLVIDNIGNDKIKWETTSTFRAGLDMSLFHNRWDFSLDFYTSRTRDLLVRKELSELAGVQYFWTNGGDLENTGVSFSTSVRALDLRDWKLDIGATIGHYKNKVTSLPSGDFITDIENAQVLTSVGNPIGVFYGYRTEGVLSTPEEAAKANLSIRNTNGSLTRFEAGDMHFTDSRADGVIDDKDRTIIGDPNPDIIGNFNLRLKWKGFTLSTIFTYSVGNDVYNALRANLESGSDIGNQSVAMAGRWVSNGQQTSIPRATYGDPMGNSRFSDRWIEDGSYLKWKSLQLSYDIPLRSTFLQGVSVWAAVSNLCTWTRYLGPDPEFYCGTSPLYMGIDNGLTGPSREINFGVKINL